MLHDYQEVSKVSMRLPKQLEMKTSGWELLTLLQDINGWLDSTPLVYRSAVGKTFFILYQNIAFPIDEFLESFGLSIAVISKQWPLCAYGTAQNREIVRLSAEIDDACVQLLQQSISGESTDILESLCLQLDCTNDLIAEQLVDLLHEMNWKTGIAAMNWSGVDFIQEQGLLLYPNARGLFCYVGTTTDFTTSDCLESLSLMQKLTLWIAFLRDGFEPIEFAWLADQITEGNLANQLEWELALWEALRQLHFRIVNQEKHFELFDETGKQLYFGADGRHASQRVLLKILFPLNY